MQDPVVLSLLTATAVAAAGILLHRHLAAKITAQWRDQMEKTNEAERKVHSTELKFLEDRNRDEIARGEALNLAKQGAFEEGRKQGRAELELDAAMKLAEQRSEFSTRLVTEKELAATEARDKQRAEHELQAKLFSVKISPYVQLLTANGLFKDSHEAKIGYQYQLLVNGIPAFQPHVFIERHEKVTQVDQSVKLTLLAIAQNCAEAAVSTYLGASPPICQALAGSARAD